MHASYTVLILIIAFTGPIIYFIVTARRGKELYIRPIAGLEAIDEAIGRATEMGRPVFYSPGLGGLTQIETLCALIVLNHIAKLCAKYDIRVVTTISQYLVYPVAEEMVREAYAEQGKSDLFNEDDIILILGQFPYAAGSVGTMHREKVAACFYFGYFYAESLLLAEGGSQVGAIQVAGTSATTQLPFFITACDYTIIGEELFAASAYLSREPVMLGSLRGQDVGKMIIMFLVLVGTFIASLQLLLQWETNWLNELLFK
ncbi:MAG: DUF6754 domain-containing protein [Planctomycetota bacterium]